MPMSGNTGVQLIITVWIPLDLRVTVAPSESSIVVRYALRFVETWPVCVMVVVLCRVEPVDPEGQ